MKKPVVHRLSMRDLGMQFAVCGVDVLNRSQYYRMTWRGVTCKNCLRAKKGKP